MKKSELSRDAKYGKLNKRKQKLVEDNINLARWVANRHRNAIHDCDHDTLISICFMELAEAARSFDPKFVSKKTGKKVKFATFAANHIINRIRVYRHESKHGKISHRIPPLSRFVSGDHYFDVMESQVADENMNWHINNGWADIEAAINTLPPRHRRALLVAFGFEQGTLQTVGDELGVSKERARQLSVIALNKLRKQFSMPECSRRKIPSSNVEQVP